MSNVTTVAFSGTGIARTAPEVIQNHWGVKQVQRIETKYSDRRRHSRIELVRSMLAAITEGGVSVTCRLRDISLSGARVTIDHPMALSADVIEFVVDGIRITAEIVWRSVREIGLRFVDPAGNQSVQLFERVITGAFLGEPHRSSCA